MQDDCVMTTDLIFLHFAILRLTLEEGSSFPQTLYTASSILGASPNSLARSTRLSTVLMLLLLRKFLFFFFFFFLPLFRGQMNAGGKGSRAGLTVYAGFFRREGRRKMNPFPWWTCGNPGICKEGKEGFISWFCNFVGDQNFLFFVLFFLFSCARYRKI